MNRRRNNKKPNELTSLAQVATALARQAQIPVSDFRYLKTYYFDGKAWTLHCEWQRRVEDRWIAVAWTELDMV